jgi:hypothetical protein
VVFEEKSYLVSRTCDHELVTDCDHLDVSALETSQWQLNVLYKFPSSATPACHFALSCLRLNELITICSASSRTVTVQKLCSFAILWCRTRQSWLAFKCRGSG